MKNLIKMFSLLLIVVYSSQLTAQVFWEGNGDGTSWNDAANWSTGMIPSATDDVEILIDATLTGEMTVAPKRVKTGSGSTVKLHLDMTLDNEAGEDHAFLVGAKSLVEFGEEGTAYTFNFNTAANRNGLLNNNSGDSATIVIMKDATLNFDQHNNAINLAARNTTFENNGTINVSPNAKYGIKSLIEFTNNGEINVEATNNDGIQVIGGVFSNTENGVINITRCNDDGIEVIDEGTFSNSGVINTIAADDAGSNNNAIAVGSADTLGYFINTFTGELNVDGGIGESARALSVFEEGSLSNSGLIMTVGGFANTRIYSKNEIVNEKNGFIDLTDGRINASEGTLVNNGFIETTRDGSGIFAAENTTVTNNAFFRYENSGQFSAGDGVSEENGFSLNNIYRFVIDAAGLCTVDIANVSYDWTINSADYASSADDGTFTFTPNSIQADSVILKTTLPEVNIKVRNICQDAVMTTSTEDNEFTSEINISPTLLAKGDVLNIESINDHAIQIVIYDLNGKIIKEQTMQSIASLDSQNWGIGQFIVNLTDGKRMTSKRIVIVD